MEFVPGTVKSSGHLLMTGPITGTVTLPDGRIVDVSPPFLEVADQDEADEIAHQIGLHWQANGHPDDVEPDPETGQMVQREFVYIPKEG